MNGYEMKMSERQFYLEFANFLAQHEDFDLDKVNELADYMTKHSMEPTKQNLAAAWKQIQQPQPAQSTYSAEEIEKMSAEQFKKLVLGNPAFRAFVDRGQK
jgi:hypothetical protein